MKTRRCGGGSSWMKFGISMTGPVKTRTSDPPQNPMAIDAKMFAPFMSNSFRF
jgi:hypothetical protein